MDSNELKALLGIEGAGTYRLEPGTGKVQKQGSFGGWSDTGREINQQTGEIEEEGFLVNRKTDHSVNPETGVVEESGFLFNKESDVRINPETGVIEKRGAFGFWSETDERIEKGTGHHQKRGAFGFWKDADGEDRRASSSSADRRAAARRDSDGDEETDWGTILVKFGLGIGAIVLAVISVFKSMPLWLGGTAVGIVLGWLGTELMLLFTLSSTNEKRAAVLGGWMKSAGLAAGAGAAVWCFLWARAVWTNANPFESGVILLACVAGLAGAVIWGHKMLHWRLSLADRENSGQDAAGGKLSFTLLIGAAGIAFSAVSASKTAREMQLAGALETNMPSHSQPSNIVSSSQRTVPQMRPTLPVPSRAASALEGYSRPKQNSPEFSSWMQENWNLVLDGERREFVIEFDWGARFGAMRWSAPISAFALSEASVGATNERGAFRDNTRVRIPLHPGYSALLQKWDPSATVNMAEAPWLTSVPPNSVVKETGAVEVYARGPSEAAELVAALKRYAKDIMPPSGPAAQATERTPTSGPQPESRKPSPEVSIEAFIRAHHEKASRRDAVGFSSDYAEMFNLKGQRTARSALLSETQAYHRDHPQISEKIVSTPTITGATTGEPRVRYRMDSYTKHVQKKDSHNVLLLELHLRSKGDDAWEIVQENELDRVKQTLPASTPPTRAPVPPARPAKPAAKPPGKSSSPLRERVRPLEGL